MKLYIEEGPGPLLYIDVLPTPDLILKGGEGSDKTSAGKADGLFLDLSKGGQHRDPSVGQFIGGKAGQAKSKEGQHDLSGLLDDMMDEKKELKKR